MCGIFGSVGREGATSVIVEGLRRLEYRGYDSSGIALLHQGNIHSVKKAGKIRELESALLDLPPDASLGIGHTRWATHGAPTDVNAHPHTGPQVAVVHNGIIENYIELKLDLMSRGATFCSATDTEVVVHLLAEAISAVHDPLQALSHTVKQLKGTFALGVLFQQDPHSIYVAKCASPLALGRGNGFSLFASDTLPLLPHCSEFLFLEDRQLARLRKNATELYSFELRPVAATFVTLDLRSDVADKQGFRHFMRKEIAEQVALTAKHIQGRQLAGEEAALPDLRPYRHIFLVGCGTAYYAALLGKYYFEHFAALMTHVELASEFRYRCPELGPSTCVIAITQSGETADTLAAVERAKASGATVITLCNVDHSSVARRADIYLPLDCGPEIGVASTKAFTAMALRLYHWAVTQLGEKRKEEKAAVLQQLPVLIERICHEEPLIQSVAAETYTFPSTLFVGRGFHYPVACEGALKLKELSYVHAEGYAGGELKHGPIALIDHKMLVIGLAPDHDQIDKTLSNLEEIRARSGVIVGVGNTSNERLRDLCRHVIPCPQVTCPGIQAMLTTICLQLYAYHVALFRDTDVDQPRNLAKSVTVE